MLEIHVLSYNGSKIGTKSIYKFNTQRGSTGRLDIHGGDNEPIVVDDWEAFNVDKMEEIFDPSFKARNAHARGQVPIMATAVDNAPTSIDKIEVVRWSSQDLGIYEEDTIYEFRRKLQIVLDIPFFKQHLFYVQPDGVVVPCSYVFRNIAEIPVNINDINSWKDDFVETVPVSQNIYGMKDMLTIESFEEFRALRSILKFTTRFYIISLDDFFQDRAKMEELMRDTYTAELVYYSFIMRYFPVLSYDAFLLYCRRESDIKDFYPRIYPSTSEMKIIYKYEADLFRDLHKVRVKDVQKLELSVGITDAVLSIVNNVAVNLLNLFNLFEATSMYPYIKTKTPIYGSMVELTKQYKSSHILRDQYPYNSLLITKVIENNDMTMHAVFIILNNGSYNVKFSFREDFHITFDELYDIAEREINPLIATINGFGMRVLSGDIAPISRTLSKLSDINMAIYWKPPKRNYLYKVAIEAMFAKFLMANLISKRAGTEYYLMKGVYKFNATLIEEIVHTITSYYARYVDTAVFAKWEGLFMKNRMISYTIRHDDVKFSIVNIKEEEKDLIYNILLNSIYLISQSPSKETTAIKFNTDNKLRKLKELDPALYDFKKASDTSDVLSKKCQKPLQPVILTNDEYSALSSEAKKSVEKYINFTTKGPAYYQCTNPDFPYIQYITGVHPQNYCIPCCKKTKPTNTKSAKYDIYNTCKNTGMYNASSVYEASAIEMAADADNVANADSADRGNADTADDKISRTRYVSHFGKDISPGKLCYLPQMLTNMFYNLTNVVDETCRNDVDYYLIGVEQDGIGSVHSIALALDMTSTQLIADLFEKVDKSEYIASNVFRGVEHFIQSWNAFTAATEDAAAMSAMEYYPWDETFVLLIEKTYNLSVVTIEVRDNQAYSAYMSSLQNVGDLVGEMVIMLINKVSTVDAAKHVTYPVIYCDKTQFYKTGELLKTVLDHTDYPVKQYMSIIDVNIKASYDEFSDKFDLYVIRQFILKNPEYHIAKYYVNQWDDCYGVGIAWKSRSSSRSSSSTAYVPIDLSHYSGDGVSRISPITNDFIMMKFVKAYNEFVIKASKGESIYYEIKMTSIAYYKSRIIGVFSSNGMLWYLNKLPSEFAKLRITQLMYDPHEIGKHLISHEMDKPLKKMFNVALYNTYNYHILTLTFIQYFNNKRNVALRQKLLKTILNPKITSSAIEMVPNGDKPKLLSILKEYKDNASREQLVKIFNNAKFEFDMVEFYELIADASTIVPKLMAIFKKMVQMGKLSDDEFPNIILPCMHNRANYCSRDKFIMEESLEDFCKVLANDLLNPIKVKYILNVALYETIINPFNFIQYPHNNIYVNYG